MLEGITNADAAKRGNAIGAIAVSSHGDYDTYPTKQELDSFLGEKKEVKR
jgi:2-dehydro-3-deoxygluconokinase